MEQMSSESFYTVAEINGIIKSLLENNPHLNNIWVKGEVYNLTYHSSGHIYFTLKDDSSTISAVFFRYANKNLKFKLEEGMKILAYCGISLFEKRGSYQLNVIQVRPEGIGELQKRIEQLRKKLSEEGLFDESRKASLPFLPKRIGIVTSPTGAAVRDIIKVVLRRYPNIEIVIAPAKVQGDDAPASIVAAIEELNNPKWMIDVIIAGRGGGSFEDLIAFNEEIVVRAFADSRVPVISAVGHQIDHPLCDDAADASAPTPSVAAEMAVPVKSDIVNEIEYFKIRMSNYITRIFSQNKMSLQNIASKRVFKNPFEILNIRQMTLSDIENRMTYSMKNRVSAMKERFLKITDISQLQKNILTQKRHDFELIVQKINTLSPLNIMSKGYSIVFDSNRSVIGSIKKLKQGDKVSIKFIDGTSHAVIDSVIDEK
ncbi:MAG: exodeoxyribonuclease VII large subunit [Leptospirales bacterium]|nr:exodeoxyribonuclease VII large subunit [Leptospirales bacterium]